MHIANLKSIIEEKFGWDEFRNLIDAECYGKSVEKFVESTGLGITFIESSRDLFEPSSYEWVFKIDGKN